MTKKKKAARRRRAPATTNTWLLVQVHSDGDVLLDRFGTMEQCRTVLREEQHYLGGNITIDGYCMPLNLPIPPGPDETPVAKLPGKLVKL